MSEPRLEPLKRVLKNDGLEAVALVPGPNFRRLFGRDFHLMERPLIVIVPASGDPVAIVPHLELASFSELGFPGKVFSWQDETGYANAFAAAAEALPNLKSSNRFGLEAQRMRVFEQMALATAFPDARFVDAHAGISSIRLRKTPDEIELLKEAIRISEAALEATLKTVRTGQSETEINGQLIRQLFDHGADGLAFDPIVAAGRNAAEPHAVSRDDYRIKSGDALLIDFGGSWRGFSADITRTFFVSQVLDDHRALYETVLAANQRGRETARAGITASDVDDAVQTVLEDSNFAKYAVHKTGHGLGLDIHEAPQIMRGNQQILEAGMVFTIEPGLYKTNECGVRIEDNVAVTDSGIECLTSFPRDLRIIG